MAIPAPIIFLDFYSYPNLPIIPQTKKPTKARYTRIIIEFLPSQANDPKYVYYYLIYH